MEEATKKQHQIWRKKKNGAVEISFTADVKKAEKENKKYRDRNKKKEAKK